MAKHDVDPVFRELVRSVNESGQAVVPVVLTVHGTVLRGVLISEKRYFTELIERTPLMSALEPSSGLLGKDYVKEVENESDYYLHLRATRLAGDGDEAEGLWRIGVGCRRRVEPARSHRQRRGRQGALRAPAQQHLTPAPVSRARGN
ncbi:MAG: hypothetical protein ABSF03_07510 [Streptosporangiaceae bacterium]|jgi:hypothetical protein